MESNTLLACRNFLVGTSFLNDDVVLGALREGRFLEALGDLGPGTYHNQR